MKIARSIIDEIDQRSDISDVIGSYVSLQKAGGNMKGLCPFHSEKTPSFTVYPATNSFYCFGCGAGGNVFTFIMKAENLDFYGAVEFLAARAGIRIPQNGIEQDDNRISRNRVYSINLEAAKYFRQSLFNPGTGTAAMRYLSEERQLSGAVIKRFGLGFAPDSFSEFGDSMRSLGFSNDELKQSDLLCLSDKSKHYYARFRNRVMFPIIDTSGNIIAFGGRVMNDAKPKYLNSADTPGFKKSRNLFALNYAKNNCAESMILCEGYMDVIALHAAGFENAVATLGTAITPEQARLMSRYTKKVILIYDSDEAGQKADERALRLLGEVGLEVRVLKLKGAKDPDEYIRKFGRDAFARELVGSRSGFEHKLASIISKHDISTPEGKIRATNEITTVIAAVGSSVEREVYIASAAEKLGLSTDSIKSDIERLRKKLYFEYKQKQGKEAVSYAKKYGDVINTDAAKNVAAAASEEVILGLLLIYDEYRYAVLNGKVTLTADDFFTAFGKRVFEVICELQRSSDGYSRTLIGEYFNADEMGRLQRLERNRAELTENSMSVFINAINALKNEKTIAKAENSGDKFAAIRLKREKNAKNKN